MIKVRSLEPRHGADEYSLIDLVHEEDRGGGIEEEAKGHSSPASRSER